MMFNFKDTIQHISYIDPSLHLSEI